MRKVFNHLLRYSIIVAIIALCMNAPVSVFAEAYYAENTESGYYILIDDQADLLSDDEEADLQYGIMAEISAKGNVGFVSVDNHSFSSTSDFASSYFKSVFGTDSGTIFFIDMQERMLYIFSDGAIYRTVTSSYANTITDNIYTYATDGDYYYCAGEAFSQINSLLNGEKIAQPMKYISNALLSIILGLLLCYIWASIASASAKATDTEWMKNLDHRFAFNNVRCNFDHSKRVYSPQSSDSSSGGGGGGSSGGGGGHSF